MFIPREITTWFRLGHRFDIDRMTLENNKIRIGNQTAFSASSPTLPFEYALNHGFNAFEWFPDKKESGEGWDSDDLDLKARSQIRESAEKKNIRLSVHASLRAHPFDSEGKSIFKKEMEFAKELGAELFNIHLYTQEGVEVFFEAICPLIKDAKEAGLKISIENTPVTTPSDFNKLFALFRNSGFPEQANTGMCLDIGHANLCRPTLNDYLGFLDQLDTEIPVIHLHLHENFGDYDSHLPLFSGPAKTDDNGIRLLLRYLKEREFSGSIILEQWPDPPVLLNKARHRLCEMLAYEPVHAKTKKIPHQFSQESDS